MKFNTLIVCNLVVFFINCYVWSGIIETQYKTVAPELNYYVNNYHKLLNEYCPNKNYNTTNFYEIKLVDQLPDGAIGICSHLINGYKVQIKKQWWNDYNTNDADRHQLIYHELSHCILDVDHSPNPNNYMYWSFKTIFFEDILAQVKNDMQKRCSQ